jgi:hypothetical protein
MHQKMTPSFLLCICFKIYFILFLETQSHNISLKI